MRSSPRALMMTLGMLLAASGVLHADDVIMPQKLVPDRPAADEEKKEKEEAPDAGDDSIPLAASDMAALKQAIGQKARVAGRVVRPSNWKDKITFLNFDGGFSVVIFNKNLSAFPEPPDQMYANATVVVFGTVSEHKGEPQIEVQRPDQVKALTKDGAPVEEGSAKDGEAGKTDADR